MTPTLGNPVNKIFIHHTAVSYKQNPDQWNATNDYHQHVFNFKSSLGFYVGYTYEIAADGTVRQARAIGEETAAVLAANRSSISICLDGNFDIEYPTAAQQTALRALLQELTTKYNIPVRAIYPHRAWCGSPYGSPISPANPPYKTCYGKLLGDLWAQNLLVNGVSSPPLGAVASQPDMEAI